MKRFSLLLLTISFLSVVSMAQTPTPSAATATTPSTSVNQAAALPSPSLTPEGSRIPSLPWVVEMFASAVMLVAVAGILVVVLRSPNAEGPLEVNPRHIQFASVCLIVPTILILGLEKVLTSETTATLIGGLAGYLLSNLGKHEPAKPDTGKGGGGKPDKGQPPPGGKRDDQPKDDRQKQPSADAQAAETEVEESTETVAQANYRRLREHLREHPAPVGIFRKKKSL